MQATLSLLDLVAQPPPVGNGVETTTDRWIAIALAFVVLGILLWMRWRS
jgi:hypothetical protein